MERKQPLHNQRGFTLVEMLVAILLMTVGVITTLSLITTAIKSDSTANRLTAKASLAQQVMEDLLSRRIDDPDITSSVTKISNLNSTGSNNDIVIQGAGTFHAKYSTSINTPPDPNNTTETNITQIVITITSVPDDHNPFTITCYKRAI